ncbi:elongation of very long chain fatty acids protein 4 [Musca vetustissima]|uniref:elongation of very long chain fatty acids protein 4 n=1 Tax=Musca vetustissima TaxID=27455 RepID=UPI002AB7F27D|nr:elongation of very long chain fatty acids protein 4 [Musca vetustissima]
MVALLEDLHVIESETRFGMSSPVFLISVIGIYLLLIYKIGPEYMKDRQPYNLKTFVSIYNIFQVVSCFYLINKVWQLTSWDIFDFQKCTFYKDGTSDRQRFDYLTYVTFWLKIIELTDTVVFVLRKKRNQITYLHVFHHSSTITMVYLMLRYYRGNGALYPIFLNCWVHVLMYTYYLLANICSTEFMRHLLYVKKSITIIQMIQFIFILIQSLVMWSNCGVPLILRWYYCVVVIVIFYGFYDFYKKAYKSTAATTTAAANEETKQNIKNK